MAQEGSEASVASTSSTNPSWWDAHANHLASWNHMNAWQHAQNPNSSSCEEDISISATSFTNASNHSGLSVGSSPGTKLSGGEPVENHLWSQVFLNVGNSGDLNSSHGDGENFLEALSSKNLTAGMLEPACDYLKKLGGSWEYAASPTSLGNSNLETTQPSGCNGRPNSYLSDLVSNWSIAPPQPQLFAHQQGAAPSGLQPEPDFSQQVKHDLQVPLSASYAGMLPPYGHEVKRTGSQEFGSPNLQPPFLGSTALVAGGGDIGVGYQVGLRNSILGTNNGKYCGGVVSDHASTWSGMRSFTDLVTFGGPGNKHMLGNCQQPTKPFARGFNSMDSKKDGRGASPSTRAYGRSNVNPNEAKKKRSEENSETLCKKSKHESSSKLQVPKVKLGDRITALQQIVSPFGKTDTASVLLEAINYVRFLHEQVQLLSDPYMKSAATKDQNSWGGVERKDKQDAEPDLSSRGLCLVPISCTPQVCRENSGPDYWTPTYRGCLYR